MRTRELIAEMSPSSRPSVPALAASIAAEAAALDDASKVAIWMKMRQAARTVMNVITAAVIAIRKVSIGQRIADAPGLRSGSDVARLRLQRLQP